MKRKTLFIAQCLIGLFFLTTSFQVKGQTVGLFYEDMGVGAFTYPQVSVYSEYENSPNPTVSYSGTGEVRTVPSSLNEYPNASGGNNIFIWNGKYFSIAGIDIANYHNLKISFGIKKCSIFENGSNLTVIANIDGVNIPIPVGLPVGSNNWVKVTTTISFPVGNVLNLYFEDHGPVLFNIDDIEITGEVNTPTPVRLASFDASPIEKGNQLTWKTALESNSAYYEVEKGLDGKTFEAIGKINSRNNPTGANYAFLDQSILEGTSYYRLKSVDIDGKFAYSWIISVTNRKAIISTMQLITNVVQNQLPLKFQLTERANIAYAIYDMSGKQTLGNMVLPKGNTETKINITSLASGMYILKAIVDNKVQSFKFIKK